MVIVILFFFNDTATTEIYTLSLHDALPIYEHRLALDLTSGVVDELRRDEHRRGEGHVLLLALVGRVLRRTSRSEEHTSELQSHLNLVCRLLLEKKKYECMYV